MSDIVGGYDEVRDYACSLDDRFASVRSVSWPSKGVLYKTSVVESGVRATLSRVFPHWELDDPSLPLFVQALAAVEAS
jgi:hypothetical protein